MIEGLSDFARFVLGTAVDEQLLRASIILGCIRAALTQGRFTAKLLSLVSSVAMAYFFSPFIVKRAGWETEAVSAVGGFISLVGYGGFKWFIETQLLEKINLGELIQRMLPTKKE